MPAPCGSRRWPIHGIRPIPYPASIRPSTICPCTSDAQQSLRPGTNQVRALHDRPFVVAAGHQSVAIGRRVLPGRAEPVLAELPGAVALDAGLSERLARHLAVGGAYHRGFVVLRRRGSERLTAEEGRLEVSGRELCG